MTIVEDVVKLLVNNKLTITTMESCTGGALISSITDVEGSSAITEGAYVTYSNGAKIQAGVSPAIIDRYGVYSQETANDMAEVCKMNKGADIGIGVTGTFNNVDPNNSDSRQGKVFITIYILEWKYEYKVTIPTMERTLQKLYVVNFIANRLKELLEKLY